MTSTAPPRLATGMLREARREAGLTQEQLADRTSLSVRAIQDLERGRVRRPQRRTMQLLNEALGLPDPWCETGARPGGRPTERHGPCQLPPDVEDFVGRDAERQRLIHALVGQGRSSALRIAIVPGMAGIGKTALATHVAHTVRSAFPDGQMYAELGGAQLPVDPGEVLARFLTGMKVPRSLIPDGLLERAELFRVVTADRRVLVVLDDAWSESTIRPLLPGTGGCAVLVTSRRQLAGIPGATVVRPGPLDAESARTLFGGMVGEARVAAEPTAAASVLRCCAGLPLAVRAAGAYLCGRPALPIGSYARELGDDAGALCRLRAGELDVRQRMSETYEALSADARRAMRELGTRAALVADLTTVDRLLLPWVADVRVCVDELVEHGILEMVGIAGGSAGYTMQQLYRLFILACEMPV